MPTTLPVLFLDDAVVLPGMVLPIELTDQAQASIDAARAARGSGRSSDLRDQTRDSREPRRLTTRACGHTPSPPRTCRESFAPR